MENKILLNKVALVTGGGTGIGLGATKKLVEAGAFVYIIGRRLDVLQEVVKKIGRNVEAIQADVSIKDDMKHAADIIKERHKKLDIIFANAGFCQEMALEDITEEFFDSAMNVNVKGMIFTVQAMLPIMKDGGSIMLTSSMTALIGLRRYTVYAATKAAIIAMAKCWATDLKEHHIRVNVLSPGTVPTEGAVKGMSENEIKDFIQTISQEIPVGRVGTSDEIGNAVVFLASENSSFINGVNLTVDGGQTQVYAGKI